MSDVDLSPEALAKWAKDREMDEREVYCDESMPRIDRAMALAESHRYRAIAALLSPAQCPKPTETP